jgi:hypothetical protein
MVRLALLWQKLATTKDTATRLTNNMGVVNSMFTAWLAGSAAAHMQLNYPSPFNASNNPHRISGADPYLQFPVGDHQTTDFKENESPITSFPV